MIKGGECYERYGSLGEVASEYLFVSVGITFLAFLTWPYGSTLLACAHRVLSLYQRIVILNPWNTFRLRLLVHGVSVAWSSCFL